MNISNDQLQSIVQDVVKRVISQESSLAPSNENISRDKGDRGVFHDMNDAISAAHEAFSFPMPVTTIITPPVPNFPV